ncbi:MAG: peptide chain release factor N(5)-glutamine methyltransferase, partial [Clostridia bacterium]|nr:peptide chain release factor N(5)-glutamine methyltransferase [Clostridia bacterium]
MTIFQAYNHTKQVLQNAGVEDVVFEAKQIIKQITGLTGAQILVQYTKELTPFQQNRLTDILRRREIRYPLQYIFGEWSFYGNEFFVGPGVLAPRPDTEILVEHALSFLQDRPCPQVLDLCAGSGCIGISIAKANPAAQVTLVEKFPETKRYLDRNLERNAVSNAQSLLGDVTRGAAADKRYDLIVSNPPYISAEEMNTISPEATFEPREALYGGEDGLDFYRAILNAYRDSLLPGGMIAFEVGRG